MSWKEVAVDSIRDGDTYRFTTVSTGVQGHSSTYRSKTTIEVEVPDLPTVVGSVIWAKIKASGVRADGPGGNGYPFFLKDNGWYSLTGNWNYTEKDLELVKIVFDAGNPGDYR